MSSYAVGKQISVTVHVTDNASNALVDPAAFTFTLKPPVSGEYATSTYAWNGSTWANSEAIIASPSRTSTGVFVLRITIPHTNIAAGGWSLDWKHRANGDGLGEGADYCTFVATSGPAI